MSELPKDVRDAVEGLRALGGDALLKQMVVVFADYSRERIQELEAAAAAGDLVTAATTAHTLKGSARQLGLLAMGEACVAVEQASKAGDAAAAQLHTAAVHTAYTTAVEWLRSATA